MSFFTRLSRPARLSLGASWLAVGVAGTVYADEWEQAIYKLTGRSAPVDSAVSSAVPPAPRTADGDCDCLPLWECMQKGGDCSRLKASLEACLAAKKAGQ